jgi:hypothetical protein
MKDIGPNRTYIKYQDIWTTVKPAAEVLKIAILSQKTLFFATPIQEASNNRWTGAAAIKNLSTIRVDEKYFWLLENRCTGSPKHWKRAGSPENAIAEILIVQT